MADTKNAKKGKVGRPKKKTEPKKAGRPSVYDPKKYPNQARKLSLLGWTDKKIADFFEVDISTLYKWKLDFPEFSEAIKGGKEMADGEVVESLYNKAIGYDQEDVKIFQYEGCPIVVPYVRRYQPDTTAAIFWLTNRQRDNWKRNLPDEGDGDGAPITMNFHRGTPPNVTSA